MALLWLWGGFKVEYQDNASDFLGGCSATKEVCHRAAHGSWILRWAEGAVELRRGEEQSREPVVAGGVAPDCEPVYGHHDGSLRRYWP